MGSYHCHRNHMSIWKMLYKQKRIYFGLGVIVNMTLFILFHVLSKPSRQNAYKLGWGSVRAFSSNITGTQIETSPRSEMMPIDNSGLACKIPDLALLNDTEFARLLMDRPTSPRCEGYKLTYIKDGRVFLNHSNVGGMSYKWCSLTALQRVDDTTTTLSDPIVHTFTGNTAMYNEDIPLYFEIPSDFIILKFYIDNFDTRLFKANDKDLPHMDKHVHISRLPEVVERIQQQQGKVAKYEHELGMNVIMLGIDSTSRLNFIRNLPKSYKYLTKTLGAVVLMNYNIVADATAGALVPMLTGQAENELPDTRRGQKDSHFVNVYPFVWNEFEKAGYVTMFAEDTPTYSTFNFRLNGFKTQPTDHYMRTFWTRYDTPGLCSGPDLTYNVMMNYVKDFLASYSGTPKFGLSFYSGLTHGNVHGLGLMDDDFVTFLKSLHQSGGLNRTMLVVFSDHGARYTAVRRTIQGKFEERLPFMSFVLPPWFKASHPRAFYNLNTNANRLTTPFDIHATLQSVLDLQPEEEASLHKRNLSLLATEIPKERQCHHADIADHWCACLNWENISPGADTNVEKVVQFVLKTIRNLTSAHRNNCAELLLSKIVSSQRTDTKDKIYTFMKPYDDDQRNNANEGRVIIYQVTIETTPGNGLFEATVLVQPKKNATDLGIELSGEISRINMYGKQADCTVDRFPHLAKFCYCKDTVP